MNPPLDVVGLIAEKRDGGELDPVQWRGLITAYLADEVDDAQMAALLMAGVIRGFSRTEAIALTEVLAGSGAVVDLAGLAGPTVDKHSTGGVGDTTTLVVAPLLAATGCQVTKLAGRGLGHTGGTIDKLEAIPGLRADLTASELREQVRSIGLAVATTTADLVPADRRLYALRDVTGTVTSPALIASSIMSKKLAGGAAHVLLDVKAGSGAFMADPAAARELAELCVQIGESQERRTGALVTDMSQPLSEGIGNALEVAIAVETLQGRRGGRLLELSLALAAAALELTGVPADEAPQRVRDALDGGAALERFRELVRAQGGDVEVADDPWAVLPAAPVVAHWRPGPGFVRGMACARLGRLAGRLGAGRQRHGDPVDPAVGLEVLVGIGDAVEDAAVAVRVHARSDTEAEAVIAELPDVVEIGDEPAAAPRLVIDRVGLGA